jgi:hypothetical protein
VLAEGRVVEAGPADQVFGSEQVVVRQLLTGAVQGPLGLRTPSMNGGAPAPPRARSFDVPLPLVALITLVVIVASAIILGGLGH